MTKKNKKTIVYASTALVAVVLIYLISSKKDNAVKRLFDQAKGKITTALSKKEEPAA